MNEDILLDGERIDEINEKLRLIQKRDGLTFGTDAFLLAAYMKPKKRSTAVELGCGTGVISLLCAARDKFAFIYAFEIQKDFSELTSRNIRLNGLEDKLECRQADVRKLSAKDVGREVEVVFANPPYMLTNCGKRNSSDAKYIARHEVFGGIGDFCSCAARLLKHGGKFYCVWRPDRLTDLFSALRENSLEPKTMTFVHADEDSEPSMILVCAILGGAPSMKISPPLILHEKFNGSQKRELTPKAQKIYDTMSFDFEV